MQNSKITRIILAAGAGTRMGQIKALLDLAGQSALQRIGALKLPSYSMATVVVGGHEPVLVGAEARALGLKMITNVDWALGQTGSLCTGIRSDPDADYFLIHPVDLPLICQEDYDSLAQSMSLDPGRKIYVTSIAHRRGHPVIFNRRIADRLIQLGPDDSIRPFIQAEEDVAYAPVQNRWVRQDLDTPADLQAALDYLSANGESTSP